MKKNFSKNHSNRRMFIPEKNCNKWGNGKMDMSLSIAHQYCENAQYQAKNRYEKTQTEVPEFEESDQTEDVNFQDSQSSVLSKTPNYVKKILNSSFKEAYERILKKHNEKFLKKLPRDAKEWYYATGGVITNKD